MNKMKRKNDKLGWTVLGIVDSILVIGATYLLIRYFG